jgi:hypothetical protein
MTRPWYALLVVVFWLVTTGWLFVTKIIPTLLPGTPPGYQALYTTDGRLLPVAWTVQLDGETLGWATSRADRLAAGGMRVESLLHFDRLPLDEVLPAWTRLLVRQSFPQSTVLTLEAAGRLEINGKGQLTSFSSTIDLPDGMDRILLTGTVEDGDVTIVVRSGAMVYETKRFLPENMAIGDELSPQASLPGLHAGRRWTVPIYSPLRPAQAPIEILHADVGEPETTIWEGQPVTVHVVTYRDDPSSHRAPRAKMWVDRTGRVLRQEAMTMGRRLTFVRRSDDEAARLADGLAIHAQRAGASAAETDGQEKESGARLDSPDGEQR